MSDEAWNEVCITDKTGRKFWNTTASPAGTTSELKNLQRHLDKAKQRPDLYKSLDVPTAELMLNGSPFSFDVSSVPQITAEDEALLKELGL